MSSSEEEPRCSNDVVRNHNIEDGQRRILLMLESLRHDVGSLRQDMVTHRDMESLRQDMVTHRDTELLQRPLGIHIPTATPQPGPGERAPATEAASAQLSLATDSSVRFHTEGGTSV